MKPASPPDSWDLKTLLDNWHAHLRGMVDQNESDLPFERLLFQSQVDPEYENTITSWSKMTGEERDQAWETLKALSEKGKDEILPICVRCGNCCKNGSPTLAVEDLELISNNHIPIEILTTLRVGEPVHSRAMNKAFYLPEEKIKIREREGTKTCAMYDAETNSCGLHPHKPAQCRAQACWDPALGAEQAAAPALTRKMVLSDITSLLTIIDAHERRASFSELIEAFESLAENKGENISDILEILAFDEHVREFSVKELSIPTEALDFIFGRPLADRLHLFGFRVEEATDDTKTKTLMPLDAAKTRC